MANVALTVASSAQAGSTRNMMTGKCTTDGGSPAVNQTITCGFKPRYIKWMDVTNVVVAEFIEGMADASAFLNTKAADTGTSASGDKDVPSFVTSNGLTPTSSGFTVDDSLAPASSTFYFIAMA